MIYQEKYEQILYLCMFNILVPVMSWSTIDQVSIFKSFLLITIIMFLLTPFDKVDDRVLC